MKFTKLCQRLAADQKRYSAMSAKGQKSLYGRFIYRRIHKTVEKMMEIEKAIGFRSRPTGNYEQN